MGSMTAYNARCGGQGVQGGEAREHVMAVLRERVRFGVGKEDGGQDGGLGMESRREDETGLMLRSTNWVLDCLRCLL